MKKKLYLFLSILFFIIALPHIIVLCCFTTGNMELNEFQLWYVILMIVFGIGIGFCFIGFLKNEESVKEKEEK